MREFMAVFWAALLLAFAPLAMAAAEEIKPGSISARDDLRNAIADIQRTMNIPGLAITLVDNDGRWSDVWGQADLESGRAVSHDTLFRIGSISKMFVGLAALKLVEEGRLDLNTRLVDIAPELEFHNPWRNSHPVRLVHLIEHTTGWDDIHLVEYGHNDPTPMTLREGLEFHPHNRTSRWRPGTRMAYNNTGPGVAAYIIEKVTGETYEDYIAAEFFQALGMDSATFFNDKSFQAAGAKQYQAGVEQPYWHISVRPAGAINASIGEMENLLNLFLTRGMGSSERLLPESAIDRMEKASSTLAAQAGMDIGYGLGNVSMRHGAHKYYGHDGMVAGSMASLSYFPTSNMGFVLLMNSSDSMALHQIRQLLLEHLAVDMSVQPKPAAVALSEPQQKLNGYFQLVNPRASMSYFLERLLMIQSYVANGSESLTAKPLLGGEALRYLAVDDKLLRTESGYYPSLALVKPVGGGVMMQDGLNSFVPVSALMVWGQLIILALLLLVILGYVIYGFIWLPKRLLGRIESGAATQIRLWPWLAAALFAVSIVLSLLASGDAFANFGKITFWSVSALLTGYLYLLFIAAGIYSLWRYRGTSNSGIAYGFSLLALALHSISAAYLLYWDALLTPTWA